MQLQGFFFCFLSNTFHVLNPSKAPGFAYAWLELISHRVFVGKMLVVTPQQKVSNLTLYQMVISVLET